MNRASKIIIAAVSSAALAGGIGAGLAYADPSQTPTASPTVSPTASPTAGRTAQPDPKERKPGHRRLVARALHGEVTLAGPQHRVIAFQRGPVDTISETSLTVTSNDGFTATYVVNADTKVRKNKAAAALSDIHEGDRVRVIAAKAGSTLTAVRLQALGR
jgi:hypothetical protein